MMNTYKFELERSIDYKVLKAVYRVLLSVRVIGVILFAAALIFAASIESFEGFNFNFFVIIALDALAMIIGGSLIYATTSNVVSYTLAFSVAYAISQVSSLKNKKKAYYIEGTSNRFLFKQYFDEGFDIFR